MKAISVKRPWGSLIFGIRTGDAYGKEFYYRKDVENRTWTLWRYFKPEELPVRVCIHVSLKDDNEAIKCLLDGGMPVILVLSLYSSQFVTGAIIGEVDITDCVRGSISPWATPDMYHFILANPTLYKNPIPYKGRSGFFEVVKDAGQ